MDKNRDHASAPPAALLYLGDLFAAEGASPLTPIFGQPAVHHLIKMLEKQGIDRFFIGVDSVPAALLAYRDDAARTGLSINFVRNPQELAAQSADLERILLLRADLHWNADVIALAQAQDRSFVATVDERPENAAFERIDLSHRWAGLAVLENRMIRSMPELPDGWDMASAIMRHAVQSGVTFLPLAQSDLANGSGMPLGGRTKAEIAQSLLASVNSGPDQDVDAFLLSKPAAALVSRLWDISWGRDAGYALFPVLALIAALLAAMHFGVAATIIAIAAIGAGHVRQIVGTIEYRGDHRDPVALASWALIAAILLLLLFRTTFLGMDGIFLGLLLAGFAWLGRLRADGFTISSPLLIGIAMLGGLATGAATTILQLVILAQLTMWLWQAWRRSRVKGNLTP